MSLQQHQKEQYDQKMSLPRFEIGDRVFVYMLAAKSCKEYKFARPFHGLYCTCIVEQNETGVAVQPVDKPQVEPIWVAYNWIRCCAGSIPDLFWPKVSPVANKRQARTTIDKEAVDNISGDQSVSSKQNMNEVERMTKSRKIYKLTSRMVTEEQELWLRGTLCQWSGEVAYDLGTQAWAPDLRAGKLYTGVGAWFKSGEIVSIWLKLLFNYCYINLWP